MNMLIVIAAISLSLGCVKAAARDPDGHDGQDRPEVSAKPEPAAQPVGLGAQYGCESIRDIIAAERAFAGQHFVEDAPKRPYVAAFVGLLTLGLLRAHVRRSTENDANARHGGSGDRGRCSRVGSRHRDRLERTMTLWVMFGSSPMAQLPLPRFSRPGIQPNHFASWDEKSHRLCW